MELQRRIRALANKVSPSPGKNPEPETSASSNQGLATLIVMITVLTIIILFCCFAAPGVRDLCKRYIFKTCVIDDPDVDNDSTVADSATTPTIILLPYGRMLVVDRTVFAQLQADHTGIDFMELSANLIRRQQQQHLQLQLGSTPSILDSETTSKGLSPISLGFSPPAYEDIFGDKNDLPPSYSEVSLLFRAQTVPATTTTKTMMAQHQDIEMGQINANNENNLNKEVDDEMRRDNHDDRTVVASTSQTPHDHKIDIYFSVMESRI